MGENHAGRRHPEHVVLEIGGELGALVVYTDPELHGREIEISRRGEDDHRATRRCSSGAGAGHRRLPPSSTGSMPDYAG